MPAGSEPQLRLTARSIAAVADPRVESSASSLAAQLDRLPYADPVRATQALHSLVFRLNRYPLQMGDRLLLLDLCGNACRRLTKTLGSLNRVSLDAHELRRQQEYGLQRLSAEFSYGYKRALLDTRGPARGGTERTLLASALLRATRQLGKDQLIAYAGYRAPPAHLWSELNSIYLFAEYLGLATTPLAIADGATATATVADSYLQLLLLERHDPFRLPAGEVHQVYDYLDGHAGLCHLVAPGDDADADAWTIELSPGGADETQQRRLLVAPLQKRLAEQVDGVATGCTPQRLGLPPSFRDATSLGVLRRMQRSWFTRPQRGSERHPHPGQVHVVTGLAAICRGQDCAAQQSADDEQVIGKGCTPAFDHMPPTESAVLAPWKLLNRSGSGLALQTPRGDGRGVSVGQLLGIEARRGKAPVLLTSTVRWLRFGNGEQLNVGVQHLAQDAVPVNLQPIDEQGDPGRERQGLLVEREGRYQLFTDRGVLAADQLVDILGDGVQRVLVTRLLETTAAFDRHLVEALD